MQKHTSHTNKNNNLQTGFVTGKAEAESPLCPQGAALSGSGEPVVKGGNPRGSGTESSAESPPAGGDSAAASGLVSFTTSSTQEPEVITINTAESRIKKMRQSVLTSARLIDEGLKEGGFRFRAAMLTLTYADCDAWKPDHISSLTQHLRMYLHRRGHKLRGVRVAELQQRGAVHYHIIVWLPRGITMPKPDKQGWWPHGMTQWKWARRAVGYIIKYASKVASKDQYPRGCRISGAFGLSKAQRIQKRWWRMPAYVRAKWVNWEDDVIRMKGGGFLSRRTGEVMPSLFALRSFSNQQVTFSVINFSAWSAILERTSQKSRE